MPKLVRLSGEEGTESRAGPVRKAWGDRPPGTRNESGGLTPAVPLQVGRAGFARVIHMLSLQEPGVQGQTRLWVPKGQSLSTS